MGSGGYLVLSAAGNIAVVTYDGPLMAISYSRAAHADFIQMQLLANSAYEQAPPRRGPTLPPKLAIWPRLSAVTWMSPASRASAPDERKTIAEIAPLVKRWRAAQAGGDQPGSGQAG